MADAARTLDVLVKLKADTAEATAQLNSALEGVQAQAVETAAAVRSITITDASGAGAAVSEEQAAQAAAFREERAATAAAEAEYANAYTEEWSAAFAKTAEMRRAAALQALEESQAQAALTAEQIAAQEAAQAKIALQMERRVIMETELEAAEARIAGNNALAAKLEREAEIRAQSLTIARTMNVTTEEAIALSERLVVAEEAKSAALAGTSFNANRVAIASANIANHLENGNVSVRSLGSLMGGLGGQFTIAAIAGYELYRGIHGAFEEAQKFHEEIDKFVVGIRDANTETMRLARESQDLGDSIKIADKWNAELAKVQVQMALFRAHELGFWAQFIDKIVNMFATGMNSMFAKIPGLDGIQLDTRGPFTRKAEADVEAANAAAGEALDKANKALATSLEANSTWSRMMANPAQGIVELTKKAADLRTTLAGIDTSTLEGKQRWSDVAHQVDDTDHKLKELNSEQDRLNRGAKEHSGIQKEISATIRDQANLLAEIRGKQQAIGQNPFLTADEKNSKLIPLITQEIAAMNAQLQQYVELQKRATDPAQWTQLQGKIQQARREVEQLGVKLKALSFAGSLRADLTAYVNQWGTSAHQIAGFIEGSMSAALQSFNQLLVTGKFNAVALLQQIAMMALQMLEQMALQRIMAAINHSASIAEAEVTGTATAAALAPAATAATIASYGAAAYEAPFAIAGAMASAMGILVAHEGGPVDSLKEFRGNQLASDERMTVLRMGEVVVRKEVVDSAPGFFRNINSNVRRPNYANAGGGGRAGTPGAAVNRGGSKAGVNLRMINVLDMRGAALAALKSFEGGTIIVDHFNNRRVDIMGAGS